MNHVEAQSFSWFEFKRRTRSDCRAPSGTNRQITVDTSNQRFASFNCEELKANLAGSTKDVRRFHKSPYARKALYARVVGSA